MYSVVMCDRMIEKGGKDELIPSTNAFTNFQVSFYSQKIESIEARFQEVCDVTSTS